MIDELFELDGGGVGLLTELVSLFRVTVNGHLDELDAGVAARRRARQPARRPTPSAVPAPASVPAGWPPWPASWSTSPPGPPG